MNGILSFSIKSVVVAVLAIITILVGSFAALMVARNQMEQMYNYETYSVEGFASKEVVPDTASINLSVVIEGEEPAKIQEEITEIYNNAISNLVNLGIEKNKIQTQGYNLNRKYNYVEDEFSGYEARAGIRIEVKDTNPESKLVGDVINAGARAGLNEVSGLNFFVEDIQAVRDQLKEEAIADAKMRATQEAKAAGIRLGDVLNVYAHSDGSFPVAFRELSTMDSAMALEAAPVEEPIAPSINIQPGETEINISVTLKYEIL